MNTKSSSGNWIWGLPLAIASLGIHAGCVQKTDGTVSAVTTTTTTPASANPTVGVVVDSAGFYVRAQTGIGSYVSGTPQTHAGTNLDSATSFSFGTPCVINPSDVGTAAADKVCYVEAEEFDLYFTGVSLQHNVPASMGASCAYLAVSMPYYNKYPAGVGANNVHYTTNAAGLPTDNANSVLGNPYCPFDYTSSDGPNCCIGTYSLLVSTNPATTPPAGATTQKWGGDFKNCLSGPAMDIMAKDKNGLPVTDVYYVYNIGANGLYTVPSPLSKGYATNVYAANYFASKSGAAGYTDATAYPAAFRPANNTVLPVAPAAMSGGAAFNAVAASGYRTNPFYEYTCYDRNKEIQARIRVLVRSWDQKGLNQVASSYAPTAGNDPYPFNVAGQPIHDFGIWYDRTAGFGAIPYTYTGVFDGYPGLTE